MGSFDRIAREIVAETQKKAASEPSLAFSAIEDGAMSEYDVNGVLKSIIGQQFDDGHGVVVVSDPEPGRPTTPIVWAGPGSATVNWDGLWLDENGVPDETIPTPTYHSRIEVHGSLDPDFLPITAATLRGTIEGPRGGDFVVSPLTGGPWYFKFVARSLSGNGGEGSPAAAVTPDPVVTEASIIPTIDSRLSASGTVQIVFNDVIPPSPDGGWQDGAVWYQTEGPGHLGNTLTWYRYDLSTDTWNPQALDEAFLPLVNIGTGTFGNLDGDRITLGSLPDKALSLGIDELIPNPKWMDAMYDAIYGISKISQTTSLASLAPAVGWQYSNSNLRFGQPKVLTVVIGNTVEAEEYMPIGPQIQCAGGDKFSMQVDSFSQSTPNVTVSFQLHCFDSTGTYISAGTTKVDVPTTNPLDVWVSDSKVVTIPNGTAYVVPVIRKALRGVGVVGTGMVSIGNVSLRRAMTSVGPTGSSMEMSGHGIKLYDAEGSVVIDITSIPPNYMTIRNTSGDSMASIGRIEIGEDTGVYEGMISSDNLSVENDPEIAGSNLLGDLATWESPRADPAGWLDQMARGLIAWGAVGSQNQNGQNGELGLIQLEFEQVSGRAYLIVVEPVSVDIDPGAFALNLKYTVGTSGSTPANPSFTSPTYNKVRETVTGSVEQRTLSAQWIWNAGGTGQNTVKLFLTASANTNFHFATGSDEGDVRMSVYDMGLRVNDAAVSRLTMHKWVSTADPEPTPPADTKKNYTQTWIATGYRSFYTSGGFYNWNTSKMYQGNSPAVGGLQSMAVFGNGSLGQSITSALSGATVSSVQAYFYFDFWYYNSGGTAKIGLHGSSSITSTFPGSYVHATTSSSWPKPGGRHVNIPSSFWAGIKSGTYRGLTLGDGSPSTVEYGYARGASTRLVIKYSK